jgi:hypothetical protein
MASTNGVIFPESMADILANPVDIFFGSMLVTSTAPATCLVIEGIAGIDRAEGMLSDTIKVCEHVKRPRMTSSPSSMPLGLHNVAHAT